MKYLVAVLLVLCLPCASQASVFGLLFGTDDPAYRSYRAQRSAERHEREMQAKQLKHDRDMGKRQMSHEKSAMKYGYRSSSPVIHHYRYSTTVSQPRSVRHGSVVIHF